jgi:sugar transferase (PEP-CTERM/EpsH1 system associated)
MSITSPATCSAEKKPVGPLWSGGESPIRVMHVVDVLALAGMEYGIIKQVNRLPSGKFVPMICCLRHQLEDVKPLLSEQIGVFELHKPPGRDWSVVGKLARLIREHRVDVLHSHNWPTYVFSVLAARRSRVPVLIHGEHGREASGISRQHLFVNKALAPFVTHFVTVSQSLSDDLGRFWNVRPERRTTVPNGVDTELFGGVHPSDSLRKEFGIALGDPVILSVGRFRAVKGYESLIRAFALVRLRHPRARLLLVGGVLSSVGHDATREQMGILQRVAAECGAQEAVHFSGDRRDIPALMSLCRVYVNASRFEGMSNTILEAMASARPVVATEVGGNPELVVNEQTGFLVPVDQPLIMADRLDAILADPTLARRLGEGGRARVERRHSMEAMVQDYVDLYAETLARANARTQFPIRQGLKAAMGRGFVWSGLVWIRRRVTRNRLKILTYHRVLPLGQAMRYPFQGMMLARDLFDAQMAHLSREYCVLELRDGIRRLQAGTLPRKAVCITFDDGYQDNYRYAWPVLRKHHLPATIFVVTSVLDRPQTLWWDEVAVRVDWLVAHPARRESAPSWMRHLLEDHRATDPRQAVTSLMNDMSKPDRLRALDEIRKAASDVVLPGDLMLTWEQVREMHGQGIRFGGHTVTHPFLDELDAQEIGAEVEGSFQRLTEELGEVPRLLAYPRGRSSDHVRRVLRDLKVEAAVTTEHGVNMTDCDPLRLLRIDGGIATMSGGFDPHVFDAEISGCLGTMRKFITCAA